jgi:threonine dehydratase
MASPLTVDDIRAAAGRLVGEVTRTPCLPSRTLTELAGCDVFLKFENLQFTASFKERGALNKMAQLTADERAHGVLAVSAGNHAQAVAYHAERMGIAATIVMPRFAPSVKVERTRGFGAEVVLDGDTFEDARERGLELAKERALTVVHPYDDLAVIAGQGTIGLEMLEQQPSIDTLVIAIGGGGLISGIAIAVKALSPSTRVIGVEVAASCPFTRSLAAGHLVTIEVGPSLADGLTGNLDPETITLDIVRAAVDQVVLVDEPLLRRALAGVVTHEHLVIEGAAAAGPAAVLGGLIDVKGNVVVILSGANIDPERLTDVLRSWRGREAAIC